MSAESFKNIPGYPAYRVGDEGTVLGRRGAPLSLHAGNGYFRVKLRGESGDRTFTVHRLVLEAFVGPRPSGAACRHLDGNSLNNQLRNLAWGTYRENAIDRSCHGNKGKKLRPSDVCEIRKRLSNGEAAGEISDAYPVTKDTINSVKYGRTWSHLEARKEAGIMTNPL